MTRTYAWFLASWAKRLVLEGGGRGLAKQLGRVLGAVEMAVTYGWEHLDLSEIRRYIAC